MTIRTNTELDKQITEAIEHDRTALDRFATTPNNELLSALTATASAKSGLAALASAKLWTLGAAVAIVAATTVYVLKPSTPEPAASHDATRTSEAAPAQVATPQVATPQVATPQVATPVQTPTLANDVDANQATRTHSPQPKTLTQKQPGAKEPLSLDHWNTGAPQIIDLPSKLEVRTKAR